MNSISTKSPAFPYLSPKQSLKGLTFTFVMALLVIVSISPHHASAEAQNCTNPPAELGNFRPESTPRASPVIPFFDIENNERTISDYAGQGVVLNFWATWCAPCIKEMPDLVRLKEILKDDKITVLALSEDRKGAAKVVPFFLKQGIADLEVLIDKKGKVARKSGVQGLPVTILIDPQGLERGRVIGIAEWDHPDVVEFTRRCLGTPAS